MVKVNQDAGGNPLPCTLYLDGTEKQNLDVLYKKVLLDWDLVLGVVGGEGNGKSVFAAQRALYLDADFNVDKIVFLPQQFEEAVDNLPEGSAIVWDESDALADHHASLVLRIMVKKFKRIRKKNMKIFLVTPTFFDFPKYFAIHRMEALYQITAQGLQRGFFKFFNRPSKRSLYFKGKQFWNMNAERYSFHGRFTKLPQGFPVDFSKGGAYDKKKDEATKNLSEESVDPKKAVVQYRRLVIQGYDALLSRLDISLSQRQHADALGVSKTTVGTDYKAIQEGDS